MYILWQLVNEYLLRVNPTLFQSSKVPLDGMDQLRSSERHICFLTHPVQHLDQTGGERVI